MKKQKKKQYSMDQCDWYIDNPINLKYTIDVEYDYITNCAENDCYNDMCRCGKIENARIEVIDENEIRECIINHSIENPFFKNYDLGKKLLSGSKAFRQFVVYGLNRLIKPEWINTDAFEIGIIPDYYGEEIGEISWMYQNEFALKAKKFFSVLEESNLSLLKGVKYLLNDEYGYLSSTVENATDCKIVELSDSDVRNRLKEPHEDIGHHKMNNQQTIDYHYDILANSKWNHEFLGVYKETGDGSYSVIDGYHRLGAVRRLISDGFGFNYLGLKILVLS